MKLFDLLLMSISNLWKRKLRTVLTVLGVVIGITSIVVMVALGNGLKESMLESYSSYNSMTQITVNSRSGGGYYEAAVSSSSNSSSSSTQTEDKLLNDAAIQELLALEHVESVQPRLQFQAIAKCGQYVSTWLNICLASGHGTVPENDGELKLFYGNNALMDFQIEKTSVYPYYENQEAPDIDLMNDPMFVIFDTDAYWNSRYGGSDDSQTPVKPPKKYMIEACGVMEGELGTWDNSECNSILCDIDALKAQLKRVFKKKAIPGQPTQKNGKPYNELFYSTIYVQVDEMENVTPLTKILNDMGYQAYSNAEWIQSSVDSMNTIQAVLGAIGAVAMLVAAISITNTMMMSIYERTKEIGVMKVLGCDIRNIRQLFLCRLVLLRQFEMTRKYLEQMGEIKY